MYQYTKHILRDPSSGSGQVNLLCHPEEPEAKRRASRRISSKTSSRLRQGYGGQAG